MLRQDTQQQHTLIVTVGLPRSGKTTWAQNQGHPIVNPDSIRLAIHGHRYITQAEPLVWAITKTMIRALFLAGHKHVILDATNTNHKRRDEWKSNDWETHFKLINTPRETCLKRAAGDDEMQTVINRMATEYNELTDDEQRW